MPEFNIATLLPVLNAKLPQLQQLAQSQGQVNATGASEGKFPQNFAAVLEKLSQSLSQEAGDRVSGKQTASSQSTGEKNSDTLNAGALQEILGYLLSLMQQSSQQPTSNLAAPELEGTPYYSEQVSVQPQGDAESLLNTLLSGLGETAGSTGEGQLVNQSASNRISDILRDMLPSVQDTGTHNDAGTAVENLTGDTDLISLLDKSQIDNLSDSEVNSILEKLGVNGENVTQIASLLKQAGFNRLGESLKALFDGVKSKAETKNPVSQTAETQQSAAVRIEDILLKINEQAKTANNTLSHTTENTAHETAGGLLYVKDILGTTPDISEKKTQSEAKPQGADDILADMLKQTGLAQQDKPLTLSDTYYLSGLSGLQVPQQDKLDAGNEVKDVLKNGPSVPNTNKVSLENELERIVNNLGVSLGKRDDAGKDMLGSNNLGQHSLFDSLLNKQQSGAVTHEAAITSDVQVKSSQEIVDQLVQKINTSMKDNVHEAYIELKPEYLGRALMKISFDQGHVSIKIQVANNMVRDVLEANSSSLKESLRDKGFSMDNFSVSVDTGSAGYHQPHRDFAPQPDAQIAQGGGFTAETERPQVRDDFGLQERNEYAGTGSINYLV